MTKDEILDLMEDELFADVIDSLVVDGVMPADEGAYRKACYTLTREFEKPMKKLGKTQTTLQEIVNRFYEIQKREEERAISEGFNMIRAHMLMHEVVPFHVDKPLGPCR